MSRIEQALSKAAKERKSAHANRSNQHKSSDGQLIIDSSSGLDSHTGLDPRITAFFSDNTLAAEQYRQLRTKVLRSRKLYSHNAFLISSALPGEGKTVTAIGLAITIAQGLQDTVLLVDSDLRKPAVHRMLGINQQKGLSEFLMGKASLEEVLINTRIDKLKVITAGAIPPNPSELISSDEMGKLITELKTRYQNRIIIFDSPPVVSITDSVILSQKVDEVLLVVYANHTPKEAVVDALADLSEANIMGVVLNHFDSTSRYYKYNYNYGYGYHQSKGYKQRAKHTSE